MRIRTVMWFVGAALAAGPGLAGGGEVIDLPAADGFRGIWYYNQPVQNEHKYKYSGGFATYPQQHLPIAIYSKQADKTFFVYGGRTAQKNELLHMAAHDGFYALWADGNPLEMSDSRLYFCTRSGEVFRLPDKMTRDLQAPARVE